MNRQETGRLLAMITSMYPAFLKDRDPKILADVWQRVFEQTPYDTVSQEFYAFVASDVRGFPPTPGAINTLIVRARQSEEPTDAEAWGMVYKALTRGIYNSGEEFMKLPPAVRKIVGSPAQIREWAMLSPSEVSTVIASSFMRSYRARQELEREMVLLPESREERLLP